MADDQLGIEAPERQGAEEDERSERDRRDHGEAHLVVGPGDRMEDGHDHGDQRQGDHHDQEGQVAEALALGHAHRHVAQHAGQRDEREDRDDPPERAADEDQQRDPADGIEPDPFAREGQAKQPADERHRHPERRAAAPPARPQGGEQHVGGRDEEADVDVVHADPRLDEEHPVGQHEDADQRGHEAASEEDPGQQVQARGRQGAEDDPRQAPGERVRAHLDRGDRPALVEHEELLAILRRIVRLDVGRHGARLEVRSQPRVGVDRVGVRLDDVDGPRTGRRLVGGRPRRIRRQAQDVDHLTGVVVDDLRARRRQRMAALVRRDHPWRRRRRSR